MLKRLNSSTVNDGTSTVETVGTNMMQIPKKCPSNENGPEQMQRKWDIKDIMDVREIGGSISPLWPSYYSSEKLVKLESRYIFKILDSKLYIK
jgi:hypothetical protein